MRLTPDRSRLRISALGALMSIATGLAVDASQSAPDTAAITRFVDRQMRLSRIPNIALVIARGEQVVYASTFGDADPPLDPDSPFLIGSVTKTFTALAIAQLADDGELRFDDPVQQHLPDFNLGGPDGGRTITLRHLLTHTSGLSQWSGHDRRAQRQASFDHIEPKRPPGAEVEYSSLNYIILGRVVEVVSGMSYADFIQHRVFDPLAMTNSFTHLDAARSSGLVRGHWYLFGLAIPGQETPQPGPLVPAGFLISSAQDLGNYLGMLLSGGKFRDRQVVSPEALQEMFTPWDRGDSGAGMAWGIGATSIGHAGNTATFSARLAMLPKEGYGIALLSNVNSGPFFSGTADVMRGVTRILRGDPVETFWPREILLKLAILATVIFGAGRMTVAVRAWSRRGFPRRLTASRRVVTPLVIEAVGAALLLFALPRWIGVPLHTITEYFPDLGIAILVGLLTGIVGALVRAFILVDASPPGAGVYPSSDR